MTAFDYSKLDYRKARFSDIKVLVPLARELAGPGSTDRQIEKRIRRFLIRRGYTVYVLTYESRKVIALALFREGYLLGSDLPYAHIMGVVVDEEYRGHGAAASFMGLLAQEASKLAYGHVWFFTRVEALIDFYESIGFEKSGQRFILPVETPDTLPFRRRLIRRLGI